MLTARDWKLAATINIRGYEHTENCIGKFTVDLRPNQLKSYKPTNQCQFSWDWHQFTVYSQPVPVTSIWLYKAHAACGCLILITSLASAWTAKYAPSFAFENIINYWIACFVLNQFIMIIVYFNISITQKLFLLYLT